MGSQRAGHVQLILSLTSVEDREKETNKIELCGFTVRKNMKAALSDLPLKAVALLQ